MSPFVGRAIKLNANKFSPYKVLENKISLWGEVIENCSRCVGAIECWDELRENAHLHLNICHFRKLQTGQNAYSRKSNQSLKSRLSASTKLFQSTKHYYPFHTELFKYLVYTKDFPSLHCCAVISEISNIFQLHTIPQTLAARNFDGSKPSKICILSATNSLELWSTTCRFKLLAVAFLNSDIATFTHRWSTQERSTTTLALLRISYINRHTAAELSRVSLDLWY